jgi:hypothetical protein
MGGRFVRRMLRATPEGEATMNRLSCLAALGVLAVAVLATVASASSPLPRLLSCSGKPLLRPTGLVVLSCADANSEIRATHWTSWGGTSAVGTTDFGLNLCTPTCAASTITFFPHSLVRLTGVTTTKQGLRFSRAAITYVLRGKRKTFTAYPPTTPMP